MKREEKCSRDNRRI